MWVKVQDENTAITCKKDGNSSRPQTTRDTRNANGHRARNEKKQKFQPETINVNSM